jgi:hypothetical protein
VVKRQGVLHEHSLCIACDEFLDGRGTLIGDEDGGLVVPEVFNEELAIDMLRDRDWLLEGARGAKPARHVFKFDDTPCGGQKGSRLGKKRGAAPS